MMSKFRVSAIGTGCAAIALAIGASLPAASITMDEFFSGQWFGPDKSESDPMSLNYCPTDCQTRRSLNKEDAWRTTRPGEITPEQSLVLLSYLSYPQSVDAIYSRVGKPHWVSATGEWEYYNMPNGQAVGIRYNSSNQAVGVTVR